MGKGLFISFEGPDGSGKSTQIEYLKEYIGSLKIRAVFTREPGGTEIGEKLREIILNKNNSKMSDLTEALLYAASRAQHVSEVIKPALAAGNVVVCDRFVDSSEAYQGYGRGLGPCVRAINEFAIGGCVPDLTFFMDLDPETGKSRIKKESRDRVESETPDFHRRVYEGYKEIVRLSGGRFIMVDAERPREEIRAGIIPRVRNELVSRGIICR